MARVSFLVLVALLPTALCCKYLDVELIGIHNKCPGGMPSVFKIDPGLQLKMADDCSLTLAGCASSTKNFTSAMVSYKITGTVPMIEGGFDACDIPKSLKYGERFPWAVPALRAIIRYMHVGLQRDGFLGKCGLKAVDHCFEGNELWEKGHRHTIGTVMSYDEFLEAHYILPPLPWEIDHGGPYPVQGVNLDIKVPANMADTRAEFTSGRLKTELIVDHGKDGMSCVTFTLNIKPK